MTDERINRLVAFYWKWLPEWSVLHAVYGDLEAKCDALEIRIAELEQRAEKLEAFKALTHGRLDEMGVDTCSGEACRVGARLDLVQQENERLRDRLESAKEIAVEEGAFEAAARIRELIAE